MLATLAAMLAFSSVISAEDLTVRRPAIVGLPDWSLAGYRGTGALPTASDIGATLDATSYGVIAGDNGDDSAALQAAIDAARGRAGAGYNNLTLLRLPAGRILVTRQLRADASFLIIRGAGSDAAGTTLAFRPDTTTRYDRLTSDGSQPELGAMKSGSSANGGWIWPGRGLFRVEQRGVNAAYASDYASAPANRKDLFEGTVNAHWKAGLRVSQQSDYVARAGDTVVQLDTSVASSAVTAIMVGQPVWVGAAASQKMYESQGIPRTYGSNVAWSNLHVRSQMFRVVSVDAAARRVTLDKPLEFDLPANNTSDGSPALEGTKYYSKLMPVTAVVGVGFESLSISMELAGLPKISGGTYSYTAADAVHNYGNLAPEYALHGIVFKWAVDCWTRDVRTDMTGSHPIVSENAKNLQIQDSRFVGSWNKGKGGNGYLRCSRMWDSLIARNTLRELRHLSVQWSSSGNVIAANDLDCDINLHGGWERHNLIERNRVAVPWNHSSGNFTVSGGSEGGGVETGTWFPIWWATGPKAGKWSCATGPQNVFFMNEMTKQLASGGAFRDFSPYYAAGDAGRSHRIVQFGWDRATTNGSHYQYLTDASGAMLQDWGGNETADYSAAPRLGVNALRSDAAESLFLMLSTTPPPAAPTNTAPVAHAQSATTAEDIAKALVLSGSDANNDALSFTIVTPPVRGTLSGSAPSVTYTPAANYNGADSFTFKVNDGQIDSAVATVSLTVTAVNDAPTLSEVASADATVVSPATGTTVRVTASDVDGDALSYAWSTSSGPGTANFATAAAATSTVTFSSVGTYVLRVTISDGMGGSVFSEVTVTATTTPPTPGTGTGTGTGLSASYFNNMTLTAPSVLTRTDATLNFTWAGSPGAGVNADAFSVRWTGQVQAPITGTYTFFTTSDDGIRLWVNGTQLINNWTNHAPVEDSGSIALVAGSSYDIRVEYYESSRGATAKLSWSCAGLAKQVVPQDRLYAAPTVDFPLNSLNSLAIGTSTLGSYTDNGSSITIAGSGRDIWNSSDGFQFASQSLNGDGTIVVRVASLQNTHAWAKAGVMVREGTGSGAKFAFCCVTPGKGVAFQRRTASNSAASHTAGSTNGAPRWLKLTRAGSLLKGYESADGQAWTVVGSVTISMANPVQIGLAVTSHNDGVLCTAVFDQLLITPSGNG